MTDELIKRLRHADAPYAKPTALEILTDEAADLIEQQAALILSLESRSAQQARTIAAMCQQVADLKPAVAPAVDAQPVAWLVTSKRGLVRVAWTDKPTPEQLAVCEFDGDTVKPLYASAQSEGLRKDAWQSIETAPEGKLLVVAWLDKDDPDNPERHAFDFIEDDGWVRHNEDYDRFLYVATLGSTGPSAHAPYTHWIELPEVPAALSQKDPQ